MKKEYARLVTMAAWTATAVASLLLVVKVAAWWVTGSVSLLASLIDSVLDIAASVVNLIVLRFALQPADHEHAFGHGKAESLAALAQAMFISGSACFLILNGVDRFFRPHELNAPELGIYVSAIAISALCGQKNRQPSDCRRLAPLSIRSADERGHHGCAGIKLVGIGSSGCHFCDRYRSLYLIQRL